MDQIAGRIADEMKDYPFLQNALGPDRVLVPVPRSAPLQPSALWPCREICDALVRKGLGAEVACVLNRFMAVQKSAFAPSGSRATPQAHFDSTTVKMSSPTLIERKITLVDDIVTRGSTFLGMYPHVAVAFPSHEIACFALIRTMSNVEVETVTAPTEGTIFYNSGNPLRRP